MHSNGKKKRYLPLKKKRWAVAQVKEGFYSIKEIAGSVGVKPWAVYKWLREIDVEPEDDGKPPKDDGKPPKEQINPLYDIDLVYEIKCSDKIVPSKGDIDIELTLITQQRA